MEDAPTTPAAPPRRRGRPPRKPPEQTAQPEMAFQPDQPVQEAASPLPDMREDMRADMRGPLRDEDSRSEAERIANDILMRNSGIDPDVHDDFALPPSVPTWMDERGVTHWGPDGWEYQWKRRLAGGAEDPGYEVSLKQNGWRAVPASRHREMMPTQGHYEIIERKGMVLMECPSKLVAHQRNIEQRRAAESMQINQQRLGQAPAGQFARNNGRSPGAAPMINRSYEPMPVPDK